MNDDTAITESSGNVFADLGLPDADELLVKADLAVAITQAIRQRQLTQTQAAVVLGLDQPKVSMLMHGRLAGFSIERLFRPLRALDRDIDIVVRPAGDAPTGGRVQVIAP